MVFSTGGGTLYPSSWSTAAEKCRTDACIGSDQPTLPAAGFLSWWQCTADYQASVVRKAAPCGHTPMRQGNRELARHAGLDASSTRAVSDNPTRWQLISVWWYIGDERSSRLSGLADLSVLDSSGRRAFGASQPFQRSAQQLTSLEQITNSG